MPRLSIVVPFEQNTAQLEATLLSILENRPRDVELILVHRGNYSDPYHLGMDELIVVEGDPSASVIELINEGVRAACASIVEIVPPGCMATPHWCDEALAAFQDQEVAAVALPAYSPTQDSVVWGIQAEWLPRRSLCTRKKISAGLVPLIQGGFYRRRVLLSLDGFFDDGSIASAECEMGLALRCLGWQVANVRESSIEIDESTPLVVSPSYASGLAAGKLARAYASIEGSEVVVDSFIASIGHVASGLMSPATVAERLGWALGVRDHSLVQTIGDRIARADEIQKQKDITPNLGLRRAA